MEVRMMRGQGDSITTTITRVLEGAGVFDAIDRVVLESELYYEITGNDLELDGIPSIDKPEKLEEYILNYAGRLNKYRVPERDGNKSLLCAVSRTMRRFRNEIEELGSQQNIYLTRSGICRKIQRRSASRRKKNNKVAAFNAIQRTLPITPSEPR